VTNDHRTIIAKIAKSAKIAKIGRPSMTEGGATQEGERRSVGACSSELVTSSILAILALLAILAMLTRQD
jgi:hypothetical protein